MMKYQKPARSSRSSELFKKACGPIPGGVNSTARATWSGWDPYPLFVDRGEGAYLYDVDGTRYIDYLLGLGPMILGHRPPKVTAAVVEQIQNRGTVFALPTAQEAVLAQKIMAAVPSVEQVRLCNTGTEAVIYSIRLARAFTGREKVVRFEGMYHGFSDGVYWSKHPLIDEAGPDHQPIAVAQGPGLSEGSRRGPDHPPLERHRGAARGGQTRRQFHRGHSHGTRDVQHRLHPTGTGIPRSHARNRRLSRYRIDLRRGHYRLSIGLRRRTGNLWHQTRHQCVCQRLRGRLSRRRPGRPARHHEPGGRRHRVHGGNLQRQRNRGGCRERRAG